MAKKIDNKPVILVTNDDGITAPGIKALIAVAKKFGKVIVVAPDSHQSAMSNAITIGKPIRLDKVDFYGDIDAYQCSGTPVDCVKLAIDVLLKGVKPTLCISGINHGSNASINVIYSGTMSAAMEASIGNIPAIGFSLLDFDYHANFETAAHVAAIVIAKILAQKKILPILYNVNIPKVNNKQLKGIKLCRQANARWEENFVERQDPMGKNYYWLTGKFVNLDKGKDTDIWALENNFASVVPVLHDLTDYNNKKKVTNFWKKQ